METIKILQVGLGPLGIKTNIYITQKASLETIAAVDINPAEKEKDLGTLSGHDPNGVIVQSDMVEVPNLDEVDIAILTTTSGKVHEAMGILASLASSAP